MSDRPRDRACFECRVVKPVAAFPPGRSFEVPSEYKRWSAICWPCTEARAWAYYDRVVSKRVTWINEHGHRVRRCSACGKVKTLKRGYVVMLRAAPGVTDWRGDKVNIDRYSRTCRPCLRKEQALIHQESMRDGRRAKRLKQRAAASKRYRARNLEKSRRIARESKARLKDDPVRYARYLEDRRIQHRLKREREGRAVRPATDVERRRAVTSPTDQTMLNAAPLVALIDRLADERARNVGLGAHERTGTEAVCYDLGVNPRTVREWRAGHRQAHIGTAERILLNARVEWDEVYPDNAREFLAHEV